MSNSSQKAKRKAARKLITPRDEVNELIRVCNREKRAADEFMKTPFIKDLLANWGDSNDEDDDNA